MQDYAVIILSLTLLILTKNLAWHHLPKTAGTSTDRLFVLSGLPLDWRDDQQSPQKHLPPEEHLELPDLGDRKRLVNVRRLPYWLLSNWHHKTIFMRLNLDQGPLKDGLFYREKESSWLPADWWLERFKVDETWIGLRVDNLKNDLSNVFSEHESISWRSLIRIQVSKNLNTNRYSRDLKQWFTREDIFKIYATNPRWAALEQKCYGKLLEI